MCFDDVKVTERPQRFEGEPRIQRLAFVKERNSSRNSDEWLVTNPRNSGTAVVRHVQRPYSQQSHHQQEYPLYHQQFPQQQRHPQQQFQEPRWQQPHPLAPQQQFRGPPQIVVPPPAPLPPPQHQGFNHQMMQQGNGHPMMQQVNGHPMMQQGNGHPIIHQGNPHGMVNLGGGNNHGNDGWSRGVRVIEAAPRPVRVIQERPRARMPQMDANGRRIIRTHSRRREHDYVDDDDDDDSFVHTIDTYDSDDSFDPRVVRSASTSRNARYYHN